jgi:shikimate kinase
MSKSPRNIVLGGFMGTGKSTVGKLVAARLGWDFVDGDDAIMRHVGKSISEIFESEGEAAFRMYETEVAQTLASLERYVIATGGGALVNPRNLETFMATGVVICLNAEKATIRRRLGNFAGRPLAPNWEALLDQRRAAYASIPYQIDTTDKSPTQTAEEVIAIWRNAST